MRVMSFVAAAAIAVVAATGCSSSSKSSSGTSTTGGSVCTSRANLKTSVAALTDPQVLKEGKASVQSAVDTVKTDFDALASSVKATYQPQVDAVKSAMTGLQTAVGNFGSGNALGNLQAVGSAVSNVGTTTTALVTALKAECPSS